VNYQLDFTGKRVLVTGSTMGIGRGVAEAFHSLGATVAINGRTPQSVAQMIAELGGGPRLVPAPGDLCSVPELRNTIATAIDSMGGLDVLVNNAGRGDDCVIDSATEEYWQRMMDLNVKAVFFATQACVPALKHSSGSIVNVASALGLMGGPAGTSVYAATKSAVVQMTRMIALELAKDGVRVNALAPGWIDTPMIRKDNDKLGDNSLIQFINEMTPVGRIGTAEECAGAVLYLSAPFAGFTTGSLIVVDGGITAGH
jgi:NAD(P)-dependent dehydrogenase (short-subunit alcohol dehydrogenase family)